MNVSSGYVTLLKGNDIKSYIELAQKILALKIFKTINGEFIKIDDINNIVVLN